MTKVPGTTAPAAVPSPEVVEPHPPSPRYERSPVVLLHLVAAGVVVLAGLLVAILVPDAVLGLESDVLSLFSRLPGRAERAVIGLAQYITLLSLAVTVVVLVAVRGWRALLAAAVASLAAFGAMSLADAALDRATPPGFLVAVSVPSWITSSAFPDSPWVAGGAAVATVLSAYYGRRWGRVVWGTVGVLAGFRLITGADVPVDLVLAFGIGSFLAALTLLALGTPVRRSSAAQVTIALARSGYPAARLGRAALDARGSCPWLVTTLDGTQLFVKVVGQDQRDASLLFRMYRFLRLKNVGDERPFSSLRRAVEHEALVSLKAHDIGVNTPHLRSVATVEPDGILLVEDAIEVTSLDQSQDALGDPLLRSIWGQVALLRGDRIAHRDLRCANLFVDGRDEPWIIDFGFSELAASDRLLQADVAELLAATTEEVGPTRAVGAAVDVLGPDAVGDCLPMLQPLAFSALTRKALAKRKGLLGELQNEVRTRTGVSEVAYEALRRIRARTVLTLACCLLSLYVLIPELAEVEGMPAQLRNADWWWIAAAIALSFTSYIGAGLSLMSASTIRVAMQETYVVSLGGSFVNRITPAGMGGLGINIRFLQKTGNETAAAVSAVGVNGVLGVVVHMSLTALFLLWAGRESNFHLPSVPKRPLLIGLAILVVGVGAVFLVPWCRRTVLGPLTRILRQAWLGIASIARRPSRLVGMVCGGLIVSLTSLVGLYAGVQAFGGDLGFAAVGASYLAGSAVGQAAPTPGGLGAVEAALIAALVAFGLNKEDAVPAVLTFRLATFWVPILPGWLAFESLTRSGKL